MLAGIRDLIDYAREDVRSEMQAEFGKATTVDPSIYDKHCAELKNLRILWHHAMAKLVEHEPQRGVVVYGDNLVKYVVPHDINTAVLIELRSGYRIRAIRLIRQTCPLSLKEAKDLTEQWGAYRDAYALSSRAQLSE